MQKIICANCGEENQVEKEGIIYCKHCNKPLQVKKPGEEDIKPGYLVRICLILVAIIVLFFGFTKYLEGQELLAAAHFAVAVLFIGISGIISAINKVILKMDKLTKQ